MGRTVLLACAALRHRCLTDYGNWVVLTLATTTLGLGALAHGVSHRFFDAQLVDRTPWRLMLTIDGICTALALLAGPWQFVPGLRWRWPQVHGWLGRLYAASAMASALITVRLAWQGDAGLLASASLLALGPVWLVASGMVLARRGDMEAHRRWMVRSFVLTATTAFLRFCFVLGLPFAAIPLAVACLGWLPAMLAVEIWLCEAEETRTGLRGDRYLPATSHAAKLGVEITLETPGCRGPGQVAVPRLPPWKARRQAGLTVTDAQPPRPWCGHGGAGGHTALPGPTEPRLWRCPPGSFGKAGEATKPFAKW
jgi:uncharacterized membrane protein